jgi:hypothetical protein
MTGRDIRRLSRRNLPSYFWPGHSFFRDPRAAVFDGVFRRPRAENRLDRLDEDMHEIIGPQAKFVAGDAEDARRAGAEHLDPRAAANAEFLQAMNVVGAAEDAKNRRRLSGGQALQGNSVCDHDGFSVGGCRFSSVSRVFIKSSTLLRLSLTLIGLYLFPPHATRRVGNDSRRDIDISKYFDPDKTLTNNEKALGNRLDLPTLRL